MSDNKFRFIDGRMLKLIRVPSLNFGNHPFCRLNPRIYNRTPAKKTSLYKLVFLSAWRRPTLTGGSPQLPSALKSLTSVFGMGTGVTSSLSPPNYAFRTKVLGVPHRM